MSTISLVIPALNEEENLPILLEKSLKVLPQFFSQFEIIVVDDGSRDHTAQIVEAWSNKNSAVKLIRHSINLGVGACLKDAFQAAKFEWVFQIPGDNQFDIEEISVFVPQLDASDVVQGWRVNLNYPLRRKIVTWIYRTLLRAFFDLNLKDATWVKMIRREIVQLSPIGTDGFFGEIEILIKAKRHAARFSEVGVHTQKRLYGSSSASSPGRILKTFFELVRFKIKLIFSESLKIASR